MRRDAMRCDSTRCAANFTQHSPFKSPSGSGGGGGGGSGGSGLNLDARLGGDSSSTDRLSSFRQYAPIKCCTPPFRFSVLLSSSSRCCALFLLPPPTRRLRDVQRRLMAPTAIFFSRRIVRTRASGSVYVYKAFNVRVSLSQDSEPPRERERTRTNSPCPTSRPCREVHKVHVPKNGDPDALSAVNFTTDDRIAIAIAAAHAHARIQTHKRMSIVPSTLANSPAVLCYYTSGSDASSRGFRGSEKQGGGERERENGGVMHAKREETPPHVEGSRATDARRRVGRVGFGLGGAPSPPLATLSPYQG